ncbi:hypothetical protein HDV02_005897 [Globomyces sp. JEL0801]|nr:hypothetical protein HDV02_005897 [Globomyces sp. JEL0801]
MEGKDFLLQVTAPVVGIMSCSRMNKIMDKNYIPDVVEFMRPFGLRINTVTTQDVNGANIDLNPCFLRFVDYRKLDPIPEQSLNTAINQAIPQFSQASYKLPELRTRAQVETYRQDAVFEHLTPWYHQYRALISNYMGVSEHETFNHPVACLFVISTADPNPFQTLKDMLVESTSIPILKKGYLDPNILKLCLLVNDPEEAPNFNLDVLSQLNELTPTHLININNSKKSGTQGAVVPDIWGSCMAEYSPLKATLSSNNLLIQVPTESPKLENDIIPDLERRKSDEIFHFRARANSLGQIRGSCLSQKDFASIDTFMKDFLATRVFQQISSQIRLWERDVASARRGISGRLFKVGLKYFGGSKSSTSQSNSFTDTETKTVMFPYNSPEMIMRKLGDYAFMIRDVKYALTIYDSAKKDFSTNEKFAKFFAGIQEMLAISTIILSDHPRGTYETYHEAAVQAYLDSKVPLYATRTTMWTVELMKEYEAYHEGAVSFIKMAKDEAFAKRNYETALSIYGDLGWTLISDHINFTLGKKAMTLGSLELAVDYFIKLLGKSRQSQAVHRAYLSEFLYLYQQFAIVVEPEVLTKKMGLLPIPQLKDSSIHISTQLVDDGSVVPEEENLIWESMERDILNSFTVSSSKYVPKSMLNRGIEKSKSSGIECAVGEPAHITFEWSNPMQVPIPVNNIHLECTFNDEPPPKSEPWSTNEIITKMEYPHFDIEVLPDIALDASEKKIVHLKLYPKTEGKIKLLGIRYLLCGIIPTYRAFKKQTLGKDAKDIELVLTITPPMPVLDLTFHNLPVEMLCGQVCQATLELNNKGGKGLEAPTSRNPGSNTDSQILEASNMLLDDSINALKLPVSENNSIGVLDAAMTTLIPVWIRADQPGKHNIKILFMYQATDTQEKGNYRTLRFSRTLDVQASLRVASFTRPSLTSTKEFILGVELTNIANVPEEIVLRQITSISPLWNISKIEEEEVISSHMPPNQLRYLYFKVSKKDHESVDLLSTPEFMTTLALERLVLMEDPRPMNAPPIPLKDLGTSDCLSGPLREFLNSSRTLARYRLIHQQYPTLSIPQINELFTLYWSDDLDLAIFYEIPTSNIRGHLMVTGVNLSLEPPLPITDWFSGLDSKTLAGRALFERTFRERKELIASLLKPKMAESSPIRVIIKADKEVTLGENGHCIVPITINIGNTSWMHVADYELDLISQNNVQPTAPIFPWIGQTKFIGNLKPHETVDVFAEALFTEYGVYDINQWKLTTKLSFPKSLLESDAVSKTVRTGSQFIQQPTAVEIIQVK